MWVSKWWCGCASMSSCVLGRMPACWAPFCRDEGVGVADVCNTCSMVRAMQ